MRYLEQNDLLHANQHGFRKHRSCETQLALYSHDILKALDQGSQVDAVFLDFRKAFDSVPHLRLLSKVRSYGISSEICDWIENFLVGRTQQVILDGESSTDVEVTSGVPQGSVLGPLLFMLYINDLADNINSNLRLFADDAVIYNEVLSEKSCITIQSDLDMISKWCKDWQLALNVQKCKIVHLTNEKM